MNSVLCYMCVYICYIVGLEHTRQNVVRWSATRISIQSMSTKNNTSSSSIQTFCSYASRCQCCCQQQQQQCKHRWRCNSYCSCWKFSWKFHRSAVPAAGLGDSSIEEAGEKLSQHLAAAAPALCIYGGCASGIRMTYRASALLISLQAQRLMLTQVATEQVTVVLLCYNCYYCRLVPRAPRHQWSHPWLSKML